MGWRGGVSEPPAGSLPGGADPPASRRTGVSLRLRHSIDGGLVYPGTCRNGLRAGVAARAWRLRVPDQEMVCRDRIHGEARQSLARDVGDFVLLRADGQYAYQLAVVVDDAHQGVNAVVRGADLLDSTHRQIWLQQCLALPGPSYAHLPVAVNAAGEKLSKQSKAAAVDPAAGADALYRALRFLGQDVPPDAARGSLPVFWRCAVDCWDIGRVPAVRAIFPG